MLSQTENCCVSVVIDENLFSVVWTLKLYLLLKVHALAVVWKFFSRAQSVLTELVLKQSNLLQFKKQQSRIANCYNINLTRISSKEYLLTIESKISHKQGMYIEIYHRADLFWELFSSRNFQHVDMKKKDFWFSLLIPNAVACGCKCDTISVFNKLWLKNNYYHKTICGNGFQNQRSIACREFSINLARRYHFSAENVFHLCDRRLVGTGFPSDVLQML